ncbi:MAG: serine/threonine protein kinase [Alphaproteobacteria bacterium]|nr:serine/threonine protein kinase [Alphaproteobacteria bacterium]
MQPMENTRTEQTPYADLSPNCILNAVDTTTYETSGQMFALNSYENRVYDLGLERSTDHIVAKFYRPGRWTREQIQEEHNFTLGMASAEIDVVAPLVIDDKTLFEYEGYLFALFPRRGGRAVSLQTDEDFRQIGRLIARVHSVGSWGTFEHRINISPHSIGENALKNLLSGSELMPQYMKENILSTSAQMQELCKNIWGDKTFNMRLHGDLHLGNVLDDGQFFLVDLDDCMSGPEIQDIWMCLSGTAQEQSFQLNLILEGYEQIRAFPREQLGLIDILRAQRMMHHAGWLANRWHDPTFPKAFPTFTTEEFWADYMQGLREQMMLIQSGGILSQENN